MKSSRQRAPALNASRPDFCLLTFRVSLAVLVLVPIVFATTVQRIFTLPKFVVLLVGAAALVALMGLTGLRAGSEKRRGIGTPHVLIVCLYVGAVAASTCFGVAPRVALFGSFDNLMGLITRVCFLVCFLGLIVGVGHVRARLDQALWAIVITGLIVSIYGFVQFFGRDPFLPASLYTFDSAAGPIIRVFGTLGHADYLGNFLLYTTPLAAAAALASRGQARLLALIATLLASMVILFSGTRGAMLGLVIGGLAFLLITFWSKESRAVWRERGNRRWAAIAALVILAAAVLIAINPASRNLVGRARTALAEGASGSGRTLLWRDALPMLPAYPLSGCGPEGFRKAFLPYKSKELAQLAPLTNNESSHNAYLDAAIAYGLPGALLYVAVFASALGLLWRARRRAADGEMKTACTGILSALVAVATHNFFIFDQLPTGLYFFVFAGLAQAAFNVTAAPAAVTGEPLMVTGAARSPVWLARAVALAGLAAFVAASWYAFTLVRADLAIRHSYTAAGSGDFDGALASSGRATSRFDPTGAYQFERARALTLFADVARARLSAANISKAESDRLTRVRAEAINEARASAERSLAHTLTPDASYVLLGYLAWAAGDQTGLRGYATEALRLDPYFANAHWLMAEALLMEGDVREARREAGTALELNPNSREAHLALKRARGDPGVTAQTSESLLAQARDYAGQGVMHKARRRLLRALRLSPGSCLECHRELALVYEAEARPEHAIAEWQIVAAQTADPAVRSLAESHIASLKQKAAGQ